jgi:hypothetical protein
VLGQCRDDIKQLIGPYLQFHPNDKANITTDCLENQFRAHELCDCGHTRHVEAQALLASIDEVTPLISNPVVSQKKYSP